MPPSTQAKQKKINELRREYITCPDPFYLLAEYAYELERVKKQLKEQNRIYSKYLPVEATIIFNLPKKK